MTVHIPARRNDGAVKQTGRRKALQAKAARRTPPSPEAVLSTAGKPLDPDVRRGMEQLLGYDFGTVRIHTDADAAALTQLIGADAVAVGQNIFFADTAYRPETSAGRHLLAHELLHTVQVPDAPAALRLGRDPGALSRPLDNVEREAESVVRDTNPNAVAEHGAQPASWLRFISFEVVQQRTEQLDPATLVDRMVAGLIRSLRGDPADASGRVRQQLARLAPELRTAVLVKLEHQVPVAENIRIHQMLAEIDSPSGPAPAAAKTPEPVVEAAESDSDRRNDEAETEKAEAHNQERRRADTPDEQRQADDEADRDRSRVAETARRNKERDTGRDTTDIADKGEQTLDQQRKKDAQREDEQRNEDDRRGRADDAAAKRHQDKKDDESRVEGEQPATQTAGAAPALGTGTILGGEGAGPATSQAPAGQVRAVPAVPVGVGGAEPVRLDRADKVAEDPQGPLVKHELLPQQGRPKRDDPPEQEKPETIESDATAAVPAKEPELETPEQAAARAETESGEDKPRPDPVPKTDPDLSSVPTADDELKLPVSGEPPKPREPPAFPPPPPVQAEPEDLERADRAEDAAQNTAEVQSIDADSSKDMALDEQAERTAEMPAQSVQADVPAEQPEQEHAVEPEPTAHLASGAPPRQVDGAAGISTDPGEAQSVTRESAAAGKAVNAPLTAETMPGDIGVADPQPARVEAGAPTPAGTHPGGSLEAGGGSCAGAEPATSTEDSGGGCGGGGAAPAATEEKAPAEPAPDLENQDPAAGLATAGTLPPAKIPAALGGVDASVNRKVGDEHRDLQENAPSQERPAGAPHTQAGPPEASAPVDTAVEKMQVVTPATLAEQRRANPPETASTGNPADRVQTPNVTGGTDDKVSAEQVQQMQNAVEEVPTSDGRLYTTVGPATRVKLEGETDPALADEQKRQTDANITQTHALGRKDAARPLGEDRIYPNAPKETLTAAVPTRTPAKSAGPEAGPAAASGLDSESVSVVAVQEHGGEIQAGVADGQAKMGTADADKAADKDAAKRHHDEQMQRAVAENSDEQTAERLRVKEEAAGQRAQWRKEQDDGVAEQTKKAADAHLKTHQDTTKKKTEADTEAERRRDEDNAKIEKQRRDSEEKARREKQAKKRESKSWWEKIASAIKDAFNALVSAIKKVFDAAVAAINKIKDGFKKAINGLIDLAAKAIAGLITALAGVLLAIVDAVGVLFPGVAAKLRKAIVNLRDAAIAKVQQLAENLKKAVNKLLDLLAGALVAVLRLYEKALLFAVEVVRQVVDKAIALVEAAIKLLGELAALITDIAPDPIGWLKKLGTAAMDGIRVYLWGCLKAAVKEWFNAKVEEVIGLGKLLWNVLIKGCMSVAKIGKMAWEAIVSALPSMIISVLIETLISVLLPAAGGVVKIAQGLLAAYQSISRIIAAFSAFLTFLKAVKGGGSGAAVLFAKALAAGAVALLEFITNFLMVRLMGAAKGVGTKLKGIAQKIMAGLGRGAKAVKTAAGKAITAARSGLKAGAAAVKKGAAAGATAVKKGVVAGARVVKSGAKKAAGAASAVAKRAGAVAAKATAGVRKAASKGIAAAGHTLKRIGKKLASTKLGTAIGKSVRGVKNAAKKARQKMRDWKKKFQESRKRRKDNKKKKPEETKDQRLARIVERLKPRLAKLLDFGIGRRVFNGLLGALKAFYRLSDLVASRAQRSNVLARLNPVLAVIDLITFDPRDLLVYVRKLVAAILSSGGAAQSPHVTRGKYHIGSKRKMDVKDIQGRPDMARELIEVRRGARAVDVHAEVMRDPKAFPGIHSIVRYIDEGHNYSHDVVRRQGGRRRAKLDLTDPAGQRRVITTVGDDPRNQLVLMEDRKRGNRLRALKYPELAAKIAGNDAHGQRMIAAGAISRLRGYTPVGEHKRVSDELTTWIVHTEARRNPAAFATSVLALDAVANAPTAKAPELSTVLSNLPMGAEGSQQAARDLDNALDTGKSLDKAPKGARELAQAEVNMILVWVESLGILTDDDKSAADVQERLKIRIRDRLFRIFKLTLEERNVVLGKVGLP